MGGHSHPSHHSASNPSPGEEESKFEDSLSFTERVFLQKQKANQKIITKQKTKAQLKQAKKGYITDKMALVSPVCISGVAKAAWRMNGAELR